MTPLDLVNRARNQPTVVVERNVRVPGPELQELLSSGRPLPVSELEAHRDQHWETRAFRYGHLLGMPINGSALVELHSRYSMQLESSGLLDLLRTVDGIHLWADLDVGRSYFGILPAAEWCDVRTHYASALFEDTAPDTMVRSYHENGDYYLLLGADGKQFTWFDPQSPGDSTTVGSSVPEFLEWWWVYAQQLNPLRDG
jgi:hypothetical protein